MIDTNLNAEALDFLEVVVQGQSAKQMKCEIY